MRPGASAVVLGLVALLLSACGGGGGPAISDARVGRPTGPNTALYFTATSDGDADRLIAAETEAGAEVVVHETTIGDDGSTGMRPLEGLELPAGGALVLKPGGNHLMLVEVDRLEVGETIDVVLTWETAGEMTVEADVVDPADTLGNDG